MSTSPILPHRLPRPPNRSRSQSPSCHTSNTLSPVAAANDTLNNNRSSSVRPKTGRFKLPPPKKSGTFTDSPLLKTNASVDSHDANNVNHRGSSNTNLQQDPKQMDPGDRMQTTGTNHAALTVVTTSSSHEDRRNVDEKQTLETIKPLYINDKVNSPNQNPGLLENVSPSLVDVNTDIGENINEHVLDQFVDQKGNLEPPLQEIEPACFPTDEHDKVSATSLHHVSDDDPEQTPAADDLNKAASNDDDTYGVDDDWEQVVDEHGQLYYFNKLKNITSWERPQTESYDISQGILTEQPVEHTPTAEVNGQDNDAVLMEPIETNALVEQLPEGWEELVDPDSGSIYYYNSTTGASSWDRPEMEAVTQQDPEIFHQEALEIMSPEDTDYADDVAMASSPSMSDGYTSPSGDPFNTSDENPELVVEDQTPESETSMVVDQDLPAGWVALIDEASNRTYYYCESENISSWDRPAEEPAAPDLNLPRNESLVLDVDETHEPPPEETATSPTAEGNLPESSSTGGTLNEGWTEVLDEASGQPYYTHQDGSTTWERPGVADAFVGEQDELDVPNSPHVDETLQHGVNATLETGWVELFDSSSGLAYYYNEIEGTTSWTRPVLVESDFEPSALLESDVGHIAESEPCDAPPEWTEDNHATLIAPEAAPIEVENGRKLPAGWEECLDPASGRPYFYNESLNETTWEMPESDTFKEETIAAPANLLIDGWEEVVDPSSGRVYYFNSSTNETSWEVPLANSDPNDVIASTEPDAKRIGRPGHAVASFAFGGRLAIVRSRYVVVRRTFTIVPDNAVVEIETMKLAAGFSGPLLSTDELLVMRYVEAMSSNDVLWKLIFLASKSNGRLQSDSAVDDPSSPESAVIKFLTDDADTANYMPVDVCKPRKSIIVSSMSFRKQLLLTRFHLLRS
jgi:hypothetical protein